VSCGCTVAHVRDYYEELWQRVPEDTPGPDFELRRDFLLAHLEPGERALDLGCGAGQFTALLRAAGAYPIGVDVAEAALARARRSFPELDFRRVSIDAPLPLDDNTFEFVWASEVIEHVADTAGWLSEIRRVLVPRGRLLLTTPAHGRVRLALGGIERYSPPVGDHLHLYTRRSLGVVLGEFGFGEISVRAAGGPPLLRRLLLASACR